MDIRTICDIPRGMLHEFPRPDALLYKDEGVWRPISTADFCRRVRGLALGLKRMGVGRGDRVALLSGNRPEWTASDHAILAIGAATVPVYPTLMPDQIAWILRDCGAVAAIVSEPGQLARIDAVRGGLPALRHLVVMDGGAPPAGARSWHDVADSGAADPEAAYAGEAAAVRPEDLASIIYTSGTTGRPKGVMLTHANLAANVVDCCRVIPFAREDVCLSFLPLSHVYERVVEFCYQYRGAAIAYAESIDAIAENFREVRPTIAAAVPRVFEKIHKRMIEAGALLPHPRRGIFFRALDVARRYGAAVGSGRRPGPFLRLEHALAERLVFRALRERLGGRLRMFISGGAPLQRDIAEALVGAGIPILEGYGMTETGTVVAVNRPDLFRLGTVGPLVPNVEVRIAEDGEILVRGPSIMKGYWNNEEATREALRDGWLRTGDIGRLDPGGFLSITDRKKELIKTSGGKMIAPQPIENALRADPFIAQAVVVGDRRRFVAALIVPAFDRLERHARETGIAAAGPRDLLRDPRVAALYEERVERVNAGLARFERIKKFRLLDREFTQERGEITPTLKYVRSVIEASCRETIEAIYAEGPDEAAAPAAAGARETRDGAGS
jgi:long-chain acyl-CoA synthetase